ncbi:hypothetical protein [Polyangium fumosum]|nr:hypothetical protein [Polyangium fumosum]
MIVFLLLGAGGLVIFLFGYSVGKNAGFRQGLREAERFRGGGDK